MAASTQKALAQLRVLDLTRVRAGPTCCRILADFGADVIKIEAPDGVDPNEGMSGPRDGYDMLNLHRNKRSITLNLKKPEGLAVFLDLVKTADVVVENYRPDVKERLGFGYEVLRQVNPRIISCSVNAYGDTGPRAPLPQAPSRRFRHPTVVLAPWTRSRRGQQAIPPQAPNCQPDP